jgi:hypothetical protein
MAQGPKIFFGTKKRILLLLVLTVWSFAGDYAFGADLDIPKIAHDAFHVFVGEAEAECLQNTAHLLEAMLSDERQTPDRAKRVFIIHGPVDVHVELASFPLFDFRFGERSLKRYADDIKGGARWNNLSYFIRKVPSLYWGRGIVKNLRIVLTAFNVLIRAKNVVIHAGLWPMLSMVS